MLIDMKNQMIREDGDEMVRASELVNYVDPHFRSKKNMLKLAARMARAGMLCRVETKIDEVGLFCVVKKAGLREDNEVEVSLRLVFDQRRGNLRWKPPPWCALGGMGTLAYIDVSHEMESLPGACLKYGTGDIPDF